MDTSVLPLAAFILTAIGWLSRELWRWRKAKRLATEDATKTLNQKKTLLEEMISKTQDANSKQMLLSQLEEAKAALLGLYGERLRHTLKQAGLPPEEALITDGRAQLQPQQITELRGIVTEVSALPSFLSTKDLLVLGNAYYYMAQYKDAEKIYDRVLDLNPDDLDTLFNRGTTYGRLERYDEALDDFNRYLELRPDALGVLNNRGITYGRLERYEEALADYNRSLELRPDDPDTFYNRGLTYYKLERYDESLADYNRSLELRPDTPSTLTNRGITYTALERYEEALADYNRALELKPDDACTLFDLACLFSLWGKTDDALAYLEKAIKGDEKYREDAKTDEDFDNIRNEPRFKKLTGSD